MIYIEQYQTLTSIPEKLNSGDKLMTLTDEGLSVKNTKTGKEYFIKGEVLHYEESLNHTYLWCALYNENETFTLMAVDESGETIASLEIEDPFGAGSLWLTHLPKENEVTISLLDGAGWSESYYIALEGNELKIYQKLPDSYIYMFPLGNRSLLTNFDDRLMLASYPDFEILKEKQLSDTDGEGILNIWQVDEHFGILSSTQGIWYAFSLDTLEIISECVIKGYEPITEGEYYYSHIAALIPTPDKFLFEHWSYRDKKEESQWFAVDKAYLSTLIQKYLN